MSSTVRAMQTPPSPLVLRAITVGSADGTPRQCPTEATQSRRKSVIREVDPSGPLRSRCVCRTEGWVARSAVPEASRPWLRADRVPDQVPCVRPRSADFDHRTPSAESPDADSTACELSLGTKPGYWDLAGVAKSARAEDLEKRICRMARKTLHPAPAVNFFPSSIDLGLYLTGTSTI